MSEAAFEALEAEAYGDAEGEAESYEGEAYEGEAYGEAEAWGEAGWEGYGEASRSNARRREIVAARRRQQARRGLAPRRAPQPVRAAAPRPVPMPPSPRPHPGTVRAIRAVDLDNKVEQDTLRRAIEEANRRASRSMYSALATGAVGQALDTYQDNLKDHPFIRAAARFAPLAILPGDRRRKGVEAVLLHPAFLSGALIGGILLLGKVTNAAPEVRDIRLAVPDSVRVGGKGKLVGIAIDQSGRSITDAPVTWRPENNLLTVDKVTGEFEAGENIGTAVVTAIAKDVEVPTTITVEWGGLGDSGEGTD